MCIIGRQWSLFSLAGVCVRDSGESKKSGDNDPLKNKNSPHVRAVLIEFLSGDKAADLEPLLRSPFLSCTKVSPPLAFLFKLQMHLFLPQLSHCKRP